MGGIIAANSGAHLAVGGTDVPRNFARTALLFQFDSSSITLLPGVTLANNSGQSLFHFANSNASFRGTELRQNDLIIVAENSELTASEIDMADNVPTISAFRLAKSALKLNHAIINTFAVPVGLADGSQVRISGSKFNVTNATAVVTRSSLNDICESKFMGSVGGDVLDITGQISLLRLKFTAKDALGANLAKVCRECSRI